MYFIFKKFEFICGLAQFAPAWGAAWHHSHPYMQCSTQHVFQINPQSLVYKMKF